MRVLTWNLYHGRGAPPARRPLLGDFARLLAGWEWDVALLQEVPPWWPPTLAGAAGAQWRAQLTSRNLLLGARRALASRAPDLLGANGGGANAILVRGEVLEHRARRLRWWPERRWAHGVRLARGGWVVNLHASTHPEERARADGLRALAAAQEWAGGERLVLGGDFNLRRPELPGMRHLAGHHVDHLFADAAAPAGRGEVLDRGALSDHPPVAVSF